MNDVNSFLGKPLVDDRKTVFYIRSSDGNKTIMSNQENSLRELYGEPDMIIKDTGSGLNEKRKGLQRLLKLIRENKIASISITQKDRLTRFGFNYIQQLCDDHNVIINIMSEKNNTTEEELMQDFMSLIASFSGKFYRLRGWKQQKELLNRAENEITVKENKK